MGQVNLVNRKEILKMEFLELAKKHNTNLVLIDDVYEIDLDLV